MKKIRLLLLLVMAFLHFSAYGYSDDFTQEVNGVNFEMVLVYGGGFWMGSQSEEADDYEQPEHYVTLNSFYIGKYEVTQGQWRAVMGNNPSWFQKGDNYPVDRVSWDDIQEFIHKLNQMTGKNYRLPTEAEWEYAARGGTSWERYGDIDSISWHGGNTDGSYHPVGLKQPNAYGLYDMLGNVEEWVQDWYGPFTTEPKTNPSGPSSGSDKVIRGGNWGNIAKCIRASYRYQFTPCLPFRDIGFRLGLDVEYDGVQSNNDKDSLKNRQLSDMQSIEVVNRIEMVRINASTFQMGSNSSETRWLEGPVHQVTLNDFYIGKYPVTQGQWVAVMGSNPSCFQKGDNYPVEQVSWDNVQEFIHKLNQMTGKNYRLPTEAEWEYAARGGTSEERYGNIDSIAWYKENSDGSTFEVGKKQPNVYGLYDMLGNVYEWVQDWNAPYTSSEKSNPVGPSSGTAKVVRGGSWSDDSNSVRATFRDRSSPRVRLNILGFRLAMDG